MAGALEKEDVREFCETGLRRLCCAAASEAEFSTRLGQAMAFEQLSRVVKNAYAFGRYGMRGPTCWQLRRLAPPIIGSGTCAAAPTRIQQACSPPIGAFSHTRYCDATTVPARFGMNLLIIRRSPKLAMLARSIPWMHVDFHPMAAGRGRGRNWRGFRAALHAFD